MKIIGISGYARSGKDTAAYALTHKGPGFYRAGFADALKEDLLSLMRNRAELVAVHAHRFPDFRLAIPGPEIFRDPGVREVFRPLLVEYGRAMRRLCADYWVRRLEVDYILPDRLAHRPIERLVITDVRYANEAAMIRSHGGIVVGIARQGVGPANDEEQRSFAEFSPDVTVYNDKSVEALHDKMLEIAAEFLK